MPLAEELITYTDYIRHDSTVRDDGTIVNEPWEETVLLYTMHNIEVDGIEQRKSSLHIHHSGMITLKAESFFSDEREYLMDVGAPYMYENGPPIVESHYLKKGHIIAEGEYCDVCEDYITEEKVWQEPQKIAA